MSTEARPSNPVVQRFLQAHGDWLEDSHRTHYPDCWKAHRQCAVASLIDEIERLSAVIVNISLAESLSAAHNLAVAELERQDDEAAPAIETKAEHP